MSNLSKYIDIDNERVKDEYNLTWKDLVCINGMVYSEEFPISHNVDIVDDEAVFDLDEFLAAVAEKYNCDVDDIVTYSMEGDFFDQEADLPEDFYQSDKIAFGAEECGAYINGVSVDFLFAGFMDI